MSPFLAHLAEGHVRAYGMVQLPSIRPALTVYFNSFFSRTTSPISVKLGRNNAMLKGIQFC